MMIKSTLKFIGSCSLSGLLSLMFVNTGHAVCAPPLVLGVSDAGMAVSIAQNLRIGRITAPDSGNSTVTISKTGARTLIASNLLINSNNQAAFGDAYHAATANISGSGDCKFRIDITAIDPRISNVRIAGPASLGLTTDQSGTVGTLSNMGTATVKIGASFSVKNTDTTSVTKPFTVVVTYVP